MTNVANRALDPNGQRMYDLTMHEANQFIDEYLDCDHGGGAYALWMEVSDAYDYPRGPYSDQYLEERCEQLGRKVAREWLAVDQSSTLAVDGFFARWQTPDPWSQLL